jgi:hypothetical protein
MKKFVPWTISLLLLLWAVSRMMPPREKPGLDVRRFGSLPVLVGGRVMPMDTLARVSLSVHTARQTRPGSNRARVCSKSS